MREPGMEICFARTDPQIAGELLDSNADPEYDITHMGQGMMYLNRCNCDVQVL